VNKYMGERQVIFERRKSCKNTKAVVLQKHKGGLFLKGGSLIKMIFISIILVYY